MSKRPTLAQMNEAMLGTSNAELNVLLDIVLGHCVGRGFLREKTAYMIIDLISETIEKADPAAVEEISRRIGELHEIGKPGRS